MVFSGVCHVIITWQNASNSNVTQQEYSEVEHHQCSL